MREVAGLQPTAGDSSVNSPGSSRGEFVRRRQDLLSLKEQARKEGT